MARGIRTSRRRTAISLTPLIDVVFILLVFFMLASTFLDRGAIALSPPASGGSGGVEGAVFVEIRDDGPWLAGRRHAVDELITEIRRRAEAEGTLRVLARPTAGTSLQDTVRVLDGLSTIDGVLVTLTGGTGAGD